MKLGFHRILEQIFDAHLTFDSMHNNIEDTFTDIQSHSFGSAKCTVSRPVERSVNCTVTEDAKRNPCTAVYVDMCAVCLNGGKS